MQELNLERHISRDPDALSSSFIAHNQKALPQALEMQVQPGRLRHGVQMQLRLPLLPALSLHQAGQNRPDPPWRLERHSTTSQVLNDGSNNNHNHSPTTRPYLGMLVRRGGWRGEGPGRRPRDPDEAQRLGVRTGGRANAAPLPPLAVVPGQRGADEHVLLDVTAEELNYPGTIKCGPLEWWREEQHVALSCQHLMACVPGENPSPSR